MPAQPIYLDVEEEIPELIERLRQTSAQDVPVVVPSRSRIGQSRFNFKLLRDYARQLGKRISIISPEPTIQHLAAENGFDAFADLEGYGAPEAAPELALAGVGGGWTPPLASAPSAPPVTHNLPEAAAPRALRLTMTPHRKLPSSGGSGPWIFLYAGAALILAVVFVAAAIVIPSASITLTARAQSLNDTANVDAAPNSAPVKVRQVTATKSLSQQFSATGIHDTAAVAASGAIRYTNNCHSGLIMSARQIISTTTGVQFVQQATVSVPAGGFADANVLAAVPGVGGNVPDHTITVINNGGDFPCLKAANTSPATGGTDEVKQPYVSQGDLDSAKAALQGTLRGQVIDELTKQAQSSEKLADTVDYVPSFSADHAANDAITLFNASVTMVGNGAVYNVDDVKAALKADLARHVPANFALTDDPVQSDFHVSQSTADGHISFAGTARGFIAPKLNFTQITNRLLGSSTASARIYLQTLPIESADVREKPITLPLLPFLSSHIHIKYVVDKGGAPAPTQ